MTDVNPHRRPVNMVFQRPTLFPHLDVFENVAFGLRVDRMATRRDRATGSQWALNLVRMRRLRAAAVAASSPAARCSGSRSRGRW